MMVVACSGRGNRGELLDPVGGLGDHTIDNYGGSGHFTDETD
jgi:hypothetical protein